jgi:hypothetical protein
MHETIPLQILDPFTELFEVGHTSPPTVQMPRSSYGLTSALSPGTSNRGHDDPAHLCSVVTAADHDGRHRREAERVPSW